MKKGKTGFWLALLSSALATAGLPPALAQNGGRGYQHGVPDVNLGVAGAQPGRAGVFVPGSPPAGSSAAGLTRSSGMLPPGHFDTPGLRLGPAHSAGTPPGAPATVNIGPPRSGGGLLQPGEGLAHGSRNGTSGLGAATSPNAEIVAQPLAPTPDGFASEHSGGSEPSPRRIPVCH